MSILLIFSLFCLVGGVIGFVKAGSAISLLAGSLSAIGLFLCYLGIRAGRRFATYAALTISGLLGLYFSVAFIRTAKIMPALIMVVLSLFSLVACLRQLRRTPRAD